jgi:ABC-type uncharacterized transport system substrate-binding protein
VRRVIIPMSMVLTALTCAPAAAHPHVFIDTGIGVVFDAEGKAAALRITWVYDDLYSLLLVGERGLDMDGDGVLTPEETAELSGFDMKWQAGFAGDTYALTGGRALDLSGPQDWTAAYKDGRVQSTHLRRFTEPVMVGAEPLVVQVYDPSYYTSYAITMPPVLTAAPQGCAAQVFEPDRTAADAVLAAALEEYSGTDGIEADFPAIGAAYAEEVRVTCGNP